ncbi:MAG: hypothetical protein SOU50_00660 [Oscillospiraceae bacterium]|nr:hypothetical protein [Oscillospiraceae bacterium]
MKMKKIISCAAAAAMALSMAAVSASAADWSQTGYADDNPDTINIVSTDANGVVAAQVNDGTAVKARITLDQVLADPADVANIYRGTYKVTYKGLAGSDIQGVGGGLYAATCNSTTFWVSPEFNDDGTVTWEDEVVVEDEFKWLLPSQVPEDASQAEFVFMDWSNSNFVSNDVTITYSDLHLYDKDGNEIAQKAYSGEAAPAAEEAPAEEAPAEEAPVEEVAPASDDVSDSASTGNASAAAIASVMAVAGVAAIAAKKRK